MYKYVKMVILVLLVSLTLQQVALASDKAQKPPKPTEGIESLDPNYGSSKDININSPQAISGLLSDWYCAITNTGTYLYLSGSSTAFTTVDQLTLDLYLQQWNGSSWVDINHWTWSNNYSPSITNGANSSYQPGYYYRVRGVHYAKNGSEQETQYSTSSYIYAP